MRKFKILKDYVTPWCVINSGSIGDEKDGSLIMHDTDKCVVNFPMSKVLEHTDWFEEVTEENEYFCENYRLVTVYYPKGFTVKGDSSRSLTHNIIHIVKQ